MTVKVNLGGVYDKLSDGAILNGRRATANQAMADMNQFVPFKEGPLRTATSIDMDGAGVNYHMNYARKQFYTRHKNYTTPGTGPRWDLKAKNMFMSDWVKAFKGGANW